LATSKPSIIESSWATPVKNDPESVERPKQTKINQGWVYGEKPSHKWFNYGWNKIDEYTHHINSNGIPAWDSTTEYKIGSVVLYNPFIYQSTVDDPTEEPSTGSEWAVVGQFIEELSDVNLNTSLLGDGHVLQYSGAKWVNIPLTDITDNLYLGDLLDVSLDDPANILVDDILGYAGKPDEKYWKNMSINEALSRDGLSSFTIASGIQYKNPHEYDVLRYDGNIFKMEPGIIQSTPWKNILNPPAEFRPPYAAVDVLGGAKIYLVNDTLNIVTAAQALPGKPDNVSTYSSPTKVDVFWLPPQGERAIFYNVYRDSLEIQSGVFDNLYSDENVERDREYTYFIKGENSYGEGPESARVIGHTFSQPSKPKNLTYTPYVNDIELVWETPDIVSGDMTYKIFRNSVEIGETINNSYIDKNLSVGSYTYFVTANNKYYGSENSNTIIVVKN